MTDDPVSEIKDFINRRLLPRIEEMRSSHEDQTRLFFVSAVTSTVIVLALLGTAGYVFEIEEFAAVEFAIAVGVVAVYGAALHGIFHFVFVHGVREQYTDEIVAPLLDRVRPGTDYDGDDSIGRSDFDESAIAQLPIDEFTSRDLFETSLGGSRLRFSEVEVASRVRKEDEGFVKKRSCFWLRGFFFVADLPYDFDGTTVVFPTLRRFSNTDELPRIDASSENDNPTVRPAAGWPHIEWLPENHPEPIGEVSIPDPEFHHLFDVYSTEIPAARNFLRSSVTERLKEVDSVWRSDVHRSPLTRVAGQGHFLLVLRDSRLYLGRPMPRSIAEIRAFEPRQQTELLVQMARDVRQSIELIETVHRVVSV